MQEDVAYALTNPGSGGRPHSRLVAFQQNLRDEVRLVNGDDQITGALSAQAGTKQQTYIAGYSTSGQGYWREGIGPLDERAYKDAENGLVVGSLQAHSKRHGHAMNTQQAAEDGHLVVANTFNGYSGGPDDNDAQGWHDVPALTSNGDAHSGLRDEKGLVVAATSESGGDGNRPSSRGEHLVWEMSHADEAVRENGSVAPTLQQRMGTGGNQVPMVGVRRLTPVECCRLQGFPDDWNEWGVDEQGNRVELSDSARYRQLGNAVCRNVTQWIGQRIVKVVKNIILTKDNP